MARVVSKKLSVALYDSRPTSWRPGEGAYFKLGGFNIYAESEEILRGEIETLAAKIMDIAENNLVLTSRLIRFLVQQYYRTDLPKRTFVAVLGRQLHLGKINTRICESVQGASFRAIIHPTQRNRFEDIIVSTIVGLLASIKISELQNAYFSNVKEGGWTQASLIAARIVKLGYYVYANSHEIALPKAVLDAIRPTDSVVIASDRRRLATP